MSILRWLVSISFMVILAPSVWAQSFTLSVEHVHTLRNCRGTLVITPEQIAYQTTEKRDAREWPYRDIQQLTIVSPLELELVTYEDQTRLIGRDRRFQFRLLADRITPEITALLAARVTRPLITSVPPSPRNDTPQFTVAVKHLHALGGCAGTLKIYADRIVFTALTDSRTWRYQDIQNFSHAERFRFALVTYEEAVGGAKAYNFQLKEDLPASAYDYIWRQVYPRKFR